MYIREKRVKIEITQEELAKKVGVKQNTVSQWEKGTRVPAARLLPKIAEVLGCSVDALYRE